MSALERWRSRVPLPLPGHDASRRRSPTCWPTASAASASSAPTPPTVRRRRALTDAVHAASPVALVAVDEEGGDVTRLHAAPGSPVLGAAALGAVDDLALTRDAGPLWVPTWRRRASTSTSARSST